MTVQGQDRKGMVRLGRAGQSSSEPDMAGQCNARVGQDRAGRAGQGRAGQGRAVGSRYRIEAGAGQDSGWDERGQEKGRI